MKKNLLTIFALLLCAMQSSGQVSFVKLLGKNSANTTYGVGLSAFYDFPLNQSSNSMRLELMNLNIFPPKDKDLVSVAANISIKLGYRHLFSETTTGFYIEPQLGFGRVVVSDPSLPNQARHADGLAIAMEGGYCVGVGERDNFFYFGLKYENDLPGNSDYNINSMALKVGYAFHLFRRNSDY
ncbi:MAG: hypothetical protein ABJB11_23730 [Ferruginibacter sp.]